MTRQDLIKGDGASEDTIAFTAMTLWCSMQRCEEELNYCRQEMFASVQWVEAEIARTKRRLVGEEIAEQKWLPLIALYLRRLLDMQVAWKALFAPFKEPQ